jgi:hypothetical protein
MWHFWSLVTPHPKSSSNLDGVASLIESSLNISLLSYRVYLNAIIDAFANQIDYAILHKYFGAERPGEARYSPAKCNGVDKQPVIGSPDIKHISTSYIERQNLTMRMQMRRFTRLTNAFSKKIENHIAAISLHYMHYNFCRVHQTLRVTPAMAAGIADRVWSIENLIALLDPKQ